MLLQEVLEAADRGSGDRFQLSLKPDRRRGAHVHHVTIAKRLAHALCEAEHMAQQRLGTLEVALKAKPEETP